MDHNDQVELPPPIGWKGSYSKLSPSQSIDQANIDRDQLIEIGRQLWRRLFLEVQSEDDLLAWELLIPNYDCKCRDFYENWRANNQPTFANGKLAFEWKWSLKSAVNQKLGHADLTLEDARAFWSKASSAE